jgi:hypothetical protein
MRRCVCSCGWCGRVYRPIAQCCTVRPATGLDEAAITEMQAHVRKRMLRAFVARGHIEACIAKDMAAYASFSVDAGLCIEAPDRAGLVRLLRYCARPDIHKTLDHIGVEPEAPRIAPARGPSL